MGQSTVTKVDCVAPSASPIQDLSVASKLFVLENKYSLSSIFVMVTKTWLCSI